MSKLLMLKGLPASGKSTRAKEIVATGNYVRVNRDLLRIMLHDGKWSPRNEEMTVQAERVIAGAALAKGLNVVVDDTNLNPKNRDMWAALAQSMSCAFETEEAKTSIEECIRRDTLRPESVGKSVIVSMALQYGLYPQPAKGFVLCDLDGTLCDIEHRRHHVRDGKKDWHAFFRDIPADTIRLVTLEHLNEYTAKGHKVIFVSARPEDHRAQTEEWLAKEYSEDYVALIMRKSRDTREDSIVKQQILDTYFKGKYPIEVVIDDRPRVIRMWEANGLNVIDVGDGVDF